jgi:hypothetical protein
VYTPGNSNVTVANMNAWDSSYYMQAFTNSRSLAYADQTGSALLPWAGDFFLLAFYGRILTDAEIAAHYRLALTNNLPTVVDSIITLYEDGVALNNQPDPAYYATEVPYADLSSFSLTPVDAENTVGNIKYSAIAATPILYISVLPLTGTLYDANTSTAVAVVPYLLVFPYTLKYRPPKDLFSSTVTTVFATFSYFAIDGETKLRSLSDATVSIIVTSQNDPPVASAGTSTVFDGPTGTIICVVGTDIDVGDTVASGNVVTLPSNGILYQVVAGAITATALAASDSFGTNQLCLGYRYTGTSTGLATDGYEASDSFTFNVQDTSSGQKSITAIFTLNVYSKTTTTGAIHAMRFTLG